MLFRSLPLDQFQGPHLAYAQDAAGSGAAPFKTVEDYDRALRRADAFAKWSNQAIVRLREGLRLDAALTEKIRDHIRATTTTRHVPARIVQVSDIPRTKSGKIVELAVRNVVHGRAIKNLEALANPEALELFRNRRELSQ